MSKRRGGLAIGLLALALGLSACGPRKESDTAATETPGGEAPAVEPATADPCSGTPAGLAKLMCGDPELSPLAGQIKASLEGAAAKVDSGGDTLLFQAERDWLDARRIECQIEKAPAVLSAAQKTCLKTALGERVKALAGAVEERGGFTFQRVEQIDAAPVTASAASTLGPDAPTAVTCEIAYPRIAGDTPAVKKFNAAVAAHGGCPSFEDQTEKTVTYKIAYAADDLISVRFESYDYAIGAAHPNTETKAVTINMATGQPLTAADVFKPGAAWKDFLTQRATASLQKTLAEFDDSIVVQPAMVAETVVKPELWVVGDKGLTILFPVGSLGGYALGSHEATIAWKDLKPYLNPKGPGPIGS